MALVIVNFTVGASVLIELEERSFFKRITVLLSYLEVSGTNCSKQKLLL